jgi:hypothetical protein
MSVCLAIRYGNHAFYVLFAHASDAQDTSHYIVRDRHKISTDFFRIFPRFSTWEAAELIACVEKVKFSKQDKCLGSGEQNFLKGEIWVNLRM